LSRIESRHSQLGVEQRGGVQMLGILRKLFRLEWERRLAVANHRAVAKQVYTESKTTAGYFLLLTLANLIALCGLLANSVPVIIGAMLISPLMGPILSFGFGFITGDTEVLRQSVRKIGFSVVLTLAVAALASYASPLQIATTEILSRTKPNLFDLLVAIFAGTAGAGALCTKRSVLTIVPGVAIATAVIPPLSVSGYGLGTGQWSIFWGGFFLFFTNFVAITIVTCLVFLSYGFKPGEGSATAPGKIRNRMVALMAVLLLVSVPLVITLRKSIAELRDRRAIRAVLQEDFDKEKRSKIAASSHQVQEDGTIAVTAVLNTTEYRSQEEVAKAEHDLTRRLDRPTSLYLEQIKTLPGGVVPASGPPVRLRSPSEMISDARHDASGILDHALAKLGGLLIPSKIVGSSITFAQRDPRVSIRLDLRRDLSISAEERKWMEKFLSEELRQPISLNIELLPLLEPLVFPPGATGLTREHTALLKEAGTLYQSGAGPLLQVDSQPESERSRRAAGLRLSAARRYLIEECGVPADQIIAAVARESSKEPRVILRFVSSPEGRGDKGPVASHR
jgi:uncharacterized hydrophobic protein (TIGR00271 family)